MDSIFNTVKNVFSQISNNNNKNTNKNHVNHKTNNHVNHKTNNHVNHKTNNLNNLRGGYIRRNTLRKKRSSVNLNLKTRNKGKPKTSKSSKLSKLSKLSKK